MKTRIGDFYVRHSARGIPTYSMELWHDGLKKHRLIRGESESIVKAKAKLQIEEWEQRWSSAESLQQDRLRKTEGRKKQEERKADAAERTENAQKELQDLSSILHFTLNIDDTIDWESLKDTLPFLVEKPVMRAVAKVPVLPEMPAEPKAANVKYRPSYGILDRLIRSRRDRIEQEKRDLFKKDYNKWQNNITEIKRKHSAAIISHEKELSAAREEYDAAIRKWEGDFLKHQKEQQNHNEYIDKKRHAYESHDATTIIEYCDLVLSSSKYPDYFPQEFDIDYIQSTKTIIVDYKLPAPDDIPKLKGVKYVISSDSFEEQFLTDAQASKLYDDVLYQIVLRTVHELFEADAIEAIDAVALNGIVTAVDRSTGKEVTACVLSIHAAKEAFMEINLEQVDPKACFKSLKGVGSSKLHGLSPVAPVMPLNKEDSRFVSAYEVADSLDDSVNLATIDWESFEHLIREIFEKEFSATGGEVKVTKASRDGGVDAIAFDPDPIRGGKIVIQAKRYSNTVGVGAVRDLYGTVLNEGATKGILVTTSDYGPDSYNFANGKPLVLMNGANILHLLEKHGHRARIDLHEAKMLASQQSR